MFVVHVRWRRLALLGAAIAAVLALTLLLSGCLHGKAQPAGGGPGRDGGGARGLSRGLRLADCARAG